MFLLSPVEAKHPDVREHPDVRGHFEGTHVHTVLPVRPVRSLYTYVGSYLTDNPYVRVTAYVPGSGQTYGTRRAIRLERLKGFPYIPRDQVGPLWSHCWACLAANMMMYLIGDTGTVTREVYWEFLPWDFQVIKVLGATSCHISKWECLAPCNV